MQDNKSPTLAAARAQAESIEAVMDDYKRLLENVETQLRKLNEAFYHAEQARGKTRLD